TIFLSCIQRATRIRCGEGPTMVPASSKITESLLLILSGWMGTRSFEVFLRKRPTASSVVCAMLALGSLATADHSAAIRTCLYRQICSGEVRTSPGGRRRKQPCRRIRYCSQSSTENGVLNGEAQSTAKPSSPIVLRLPQSIIFIRGSGGPRDPPKGSEL